METLSVSTRGTSERDIDSWKRLADTQKKYLEEAIEEKQTWEANYATLKDATGRQITQLREALQSHTRDSEDTRARERAALEKRVAELEEALKEEQLARGVVTIGGVVASASSSSVSRVVEGPFSSEGGGGHTATMTAGRDQVQGLGAIAMYDRVVAAESELAFERGKRKEAELYLNRILKDMQNNAPVVAAQKRDFNRVLESHNHLTRRLDEVTAENGSLRDQLRVAVGKAAQAEEDANALTQHNSDLSTQLQNLLKHSWDQQYGATGGSRPPVALIGYGGDESSSSSASAGGVITEHLLTFDDVKDLQQNNAKLLKVIRKLSQEQEMLEARVRTAGSSDALVPFMGTGDGAVGDKGDPSTTLALHTALQELQSLRETRQRTEELVKTLVQQRDLYKVGTIRECFLVPYT